MHEYPSDKNGWIRWLGSVYKKCQRNEQAGWSELQGGMMHLVERWAQVDAREQALRDRTAQARAWEVEVRQEMEETQTRLRQEAAARAQAQTELREARKEIERLRAGQAPGIGRKPFGRGGETATATRTVQIVKGRGRPPETPEARPAPYASLPDAIEDREDAVRVGAAFAAWCQTGGPVVSERDRFGARLAAEVPGATVRSVYRDRDSPRLPVLFGSNGGRSPAEYWMVEGVGGPWLLPFPQGPRQFRDLAEGTFGGGRVAPRSLATFRPAALEKVGAEWKVSRPGYLSASS